MIAAVDLHPRPADRYARRALAGGAAATVCAIPFTGLRRAAAPGMASLPKAPAVGEAAFAAQLGRVPATRNALVMERSALRRPDAVDVLVLDETALGSGRSVPSDPVPLPDTGQGTTGQAFVGSADAAERAFALFDRLDPQVRRGTREQRRFAGHAAVLGLTKGRRLKAVLVEPARHSTC